MTVLQNSSIALFPWIIFSIWGKITASSVNPDTVIEILGEVLCRLEPEARHGGRFMASLWWNSEVRDVSVALSGIGELKLVVSNALKEKGFSDVHINNLEVAGAKNGVWISIGHFHIADRRFWEIVMGSGDTGEQTKGIVNEVVTLLRGLRFL